MGRSIATKHRAITGFSAVISSYCCEVTPAFAEEGTG